MTELGPINGREAYNQLANNKTFHAFTGSIKGKKEEADNFWYEIEPCSSDHDDPEAEAFWAEFAKE